MVYAKSYFFHEEGLKPNMEYFKNLQYKQNLNCVFNFFKTLMHKSILEQILVQRFLRITTCRGNQSWFQRENTLLIMTEPAKKSVRSDVTWFYWKTFLFKLFPNILCVNRWLRASQRDGSKILKVDQLSPSYWTSASTCCDVPVRYTRITTGK